MSSTDNRSIPELFGDALGQLAKLVGNEFDLARAEISEKANQAGRAAALIREGISDPVAYLITGAGAAVVAAILVGIGASRLSGDALKPAATLDQMQRDKIAAKEMVR